jgi:phage terminase small subunit
MKRVKIPPKRPKRKIPSPGNGTVDKNAHLKGTRIFGKDGLNLKQRRFVEEYIIDLNQTKAAIRAGYSERTAYSIGNELLNKPEVRMAVEKAQEARAKRTAITADRVLIEIAELAFGDVREACKASHTLSAKLGALQLLAKHTGVAQDRLLVDQRTTTQVNVNVTHTDLDAARAEIAQAFRDRPQPLQIEYKPGERIQ